MQFQRLACTSVFLVCAYSVAVFASPAPSPMQMQMHMIERDVTPDSNIQVRNWYSNVDMMPRYNGGDVTSAYHAAVLEGRTPPRPGSRPKAPSVKHPNAPAPIPKSKPNNTPAPRPNTPNTRPAHKPAAAQCGTNSNGKTKRSFSPTCQTTSLTLGGVTHSITKVADQGNSAITYKVDGGWPDPTNGQLVTAYAKTGSRPGMTFADEAKWLGKTEQLLAEGNYDGHNFIVFRGVTGKSHLVATNFAAQLGPVMMGQANLARCEALVKQKLDLVIQEVKTYVIRFGILHTDVQPGNILWDMAATDPTLIDWGRAKDVGVGHWTAEIEAQVRKQAEFSHLRGEEKLCGLS